MSTRYIIILILVQISNQVFGTVVILNGLTHQYTGSEGSIITGKIKLKNDGATDERVLAYKQDLIFPCDQSDFFSNTITHERTLKNWLTTGVDDKVLSAGEEYDLSYTINVPKVVSQKGTYWVVIMIEPGNPISSTQKTGFNIDSKVRYAVQILVDLGAFESPQMTFEDIELKKTEVASKLISIQLKNNGLFAVRTKIQLEIYDSDSKKIKTIEAKPRRVFPQKCNHFEIEVSDLPKGSYDGIIVADNGKKLVGSNITIDIE